MKFILGLAAIGAILGPASAHSWVEEMQVIDSSTGNYTGDYGFPRGYVARTDPGFNGDSMNYLLPALSTGRTRIDGSDLLCHPSQRKSNYDNAAYPRLKATPGSYVAMKYLENGHVTLPQGQKGKPEAGGPVFVFGTTKPSDTEKIADVLKWNKQGNGGDKRGTLLAANNYDDGRCHQINPGTLSTQRQQNFADRVAGQPSSSVEQWCETDMQIPSSQKPGDVLTVYWVWSWPTAPAQDPVYPQGKDEYYTSCAEIEIVDKIGNDKVVHTLVQQDPQTAAVKDFKSRTAITPTPVFTLDGSASMTGYSAPASSSSTSTSTSSSSSSSTSSTRSAEPFTDLPTISLPGKPTITNKPSSASKNTYLPSILTVTNYITLSDLHQKQQQDTKTKTEFVTSYVTATPSTVTVSNTPSPAAAPDDAGSAGVVGRSFSA